MKFRGHDSTLTLFSATLEELLASIPLNNKCKDFIHNVLYRRDLVAPNPVLPFVDRDTTYDEADAADHDDAIPHDEDGAPSGDEDEESDTENEDAPRKDPAKPPSKKRQNRQKRPAATGADGIEETPSALLLALKDRFNNELQQFLVALIDLHLSGTNATFSAYWNQVSDKSKVLIVDISGGRFDSVHRVPHRAKRSEERV